jgi:hypothetical protein
VRSHPPVPQVVLTCSGLPNSFVALQLVLPYVLTATAIEDLEMCILQRLLQHDHIQQ